MPRQTITVVVEYDAEPLDLSEVEDIVQALAGPIAEYGERVVVAISEVRS